MSGWGNTNENGIFLPNHLKKVSVPAVSNAVCKEAYEDNYLVKESMLCTGDMENGGIGSCQGDSGGPVTTDDHKTLVGLVSWGVGCARPGLPSVNTQVSHFVDWIFNIIDKNS